jgi:hypothetical protein
MEGLTKMRVDTQFSVFLINKPGVLASVTGALAKARVNLTALALMDSGEHGALRLVCDDADKARQVLGKAHDRWTETEVVVMDLDNEPGAFATVAKRLADEHVNITYAYCTGGAFGGKTTAVFKVMDLKKAINLLDAMKAEKAQKNPVKTAKGRKD